MSTIEAGHRYTFTIPEMPWHRARAIPDVLTVIPARGGSKGIPMKNLAQVAGRTLLAHTIEHAIRAELAGRIVVSSEHPDIIAEAERYDVEVVRRPEELAGDYSPSEEAILHALDETGATPDVVVMLQCTNPFRNPSDIDACVNMIVEESYDAVLSVTRMGQFVWEDDGRGAWALNYNPLGQRPMRQQVRQYIENGSIYAFRPWVIERYGTRLGGRMGLYEMGPNSRFEIDSPDDLRLARWLLGDAR